MTALYALLFSLVATASEGPRVALPPGPEANVARTYMRLIQSANAFDVDDAIEARETLLDEHGEMVLRIGSSDQLDALMALGEPFPTRQIDFWQGVQPLKGERYMVVWWHPARSSSRRIVLGAQAIADRYGIPVVAVVPDGTESERKAAAEMVAICPRVTFASAPSRILDEIDLTVLPQLSVVEEGRVIWQGAWEQLAFTPLAP